jgi:hypothetical protein
MKLSFVVYQDTVGSVWKMTFGFGLGTVYRVFKLKLKIVHHLLKAFSLKPFFFYTGAGEIPTVICRARKSGYYLATFHELEKETRFKEL